MTHNCQGFVVFLIIVISRTYSIPPSDTGVLSVAEESQTRRGRVLHFIDNLDVLFVKNNNDVCEILTNQLKAACQPVKLLLHPVTAVETCNVTTLFKRTARGNRVPKQCI